MTNNFDHQSPLLTSTADAVLGALSDHTRRRILTRLATRPDDAGAVARDLKVSRQAVAKQLRILEDAGLVQANTIDRRRVHSVEPSRVRETSELLGIAANGWDRRLARVKDLAEEPPSAE